MASVFISYRRSDSAAWADRLFDHLSMRFGKDLVFQDVETLGPGDLWCARIAEAISQCEVVLVVIGPSWVTVVDDQGRRRLGDEQDVLRREVAQALASPCTVVPILVGGAQMPSREELPENLQALGDRNAFAVRDSTWNEDVARLIESLRELITPLRGTVSLDRIRQEAYGKQREYFDLVETRHDEAGALESAQQLSRLLDRHMPLFPDDAYLKSCRGYSLKNEAMALRALGRLGEFGEALGEADRVFRTMRAENPNDASAWNGSGSVAALRGDFERALEFIDKALALDPKYEAALHDRALVQQQIGARQAGRP